MVEQYSHSPVYGLATVKSLADREKARWRGPNTYLRCQRELNLNFAQACQEIAWLQPGDYDKTFKYKGSQAPDDAYKVEIRDGRGRRVIAYIKIRIDCDGTELEIDIGSFHG